jgi:hypothetical protein
MRLTPSSVAVSLACANLALAGIYGTSPVANTVWTAGRSESIIWTDDKSNPKLSKLGPMDIELYSGVDVSSSTRSEHSILTLGWLATEPRFSLSS